MKRMLLVLAALLALPLVAVAQETPKVFALYAGVNGMWFDEPTAFPNDFEMGVNGRASLSPHISAVASAYYGFSHSYLRGSGGVRVTTTDVNNREFSIGVGMQYHVSSEPALRPEELVSDVTVGWRPWAATLPRWVLGVQGQYGLDSSQASALAAVRYSLGTF